MAKFKFKYDSVKKIKERQEEQIKNKINDLDQEINNIELQKTALLDQLKALRIDLTGRISALQIKFSKDFETHTYNSLKTLDSKIKSIQIKKDELLKQLVEKRKECKIFEKLEEKHRLDFMHEENKIDNELMNEIAIRKYTRSLQ